jgi:hypothetical protein
VDGRNLQHHTSIVHHSKFSEPMTAQGLTQNLPGCNMAVCFTSIKGHYLPYFSREPFSSIIVISSSSIDLLEFVPAIAPRTSHRAVLGKEGGWRHVGGRMGGRCRCRNPAPFHCQENQIVGDARILPFDCQLDHSRHLYAYNSQLDYSRHL